MNGGNGRLKLLWNAITSRAALTRSLLDPRRDLNTECGYLDDPTLEDFEAMYQQEGIARRVVNILPDECWKVSPIVYESEEAEQTEFEVAWKELEKKFDIYALMNRADVLAGIGRFGIILIGVGDGADLSEPVRRKKGLELLYLRAFDETVVKIAETETDSQSPRYGWPKAYDVTFRGTGQNKGGSSKRVHWERVIHVADNCRLSDVTGESRLRPVFNRLQDIRKLLGGSAEMFWQGAFPGLSFEVDPKLIEAGAAEIDTESLKEQLQNYVNGLQRWLSTVGVSVRSLAPQVADPASHIEQQLKAIALSLGVPYRVFLGTEEGRLAGQQDAEAFAQRIAQRQERFLTPKIVRPFIQRLIDFGILPKPRSFTVEWPDMLAPSDHDKAETAKIRTEALKAYVTGDGYTVIPPRIYLMEVLGFTPEQAEAMIEESAMEAEE